VPADGPLAAPTNVFVNPDSGRAWLLFVAPVGLASGFEWQFTGAEGWSSVTMPVSLPVLLADLENDREYCVVVRALGVNGVPGVASAPVCFTPSALAVVIPEAALEIASPDEVFEVRPVDGVATLVVEFELDSTGDDTLVNAWLIPRGFGDNARVVAMAPDANRGTITQYGTRWFWQGVNLEPGGSAGGTLTIRLEVK